MVITLVAPTWTNGLHITTPALLAAMNLFRSQYAWLPWLVDSSCCGSNDYSQLCNARLQWRKDVPSQRFELPRLVEGAAVALRFYHYYHWCVAFPARDCRSHPVWRWSVDCVDPSHRVRVPESPYHPENSAVWIFGEDVRPILCGRAGEDGVSLRGRDPRVDREQKTFVSW